MNLHFQRWMTGAVAIPILFAIIAYGKETLFNGLIIVAVLLGIGEYNRMVFCSGFCREKAETLVGGLLILGAASTGNGTFLAAVLTLMVMAVMILNLWPSGERPVEMASVGKVLFGILYIPLLIAHFILIRQIPEGVQWVFFILTVAFAGDIAAYYVGRGMGKRKLFPQVSPGKTVEGVIGLFAGSTAGAVLFAYYFLPALPCWQAGLLGLLGGIAGQLGDLVESALKRVAGVKDSGMLLPGHGGILDRLDCLTFIAPLFYYYRVILLS